MWLEVFSITVSRESSKVRGSHAIYCSETHIVLVWVVVCREHNFSEVLEDMCMEGSRKREVVYLFVPCHEQKFSAFQLSL